MRGPLHGENGVTALSPFAAIKYFMTANIGNEYTNLWG